MTKPFSERAGEIFDKAGDYEDKTGRAPTAKDLARLTGRSLEEVHFILHRMVDHGVLVMIPSAYDERYAVDDEEKLETLPTPEQEPSFGQARAERDEAISRQVDKISERFKDGYVDEDKQKTFADVAARLAGKGEKKANPLDGEIPAPAPTAKPGRDELFDKLSRELAGKGEKKINPLDALTKKKS